MAVCDRGQVIFSLHASGSRAETNDRVNLTSLVVRVAHKVCHMLRRGSGPQSVLRKYQQHQGKSGLYVMRVCCRGKGNVEWKILEIFMQDLEMWERQTISCAVFFMQAMPLLSAIIFLPCYTIGSSFR